MQPSKELLCLDNFVTVQCAANAKCINNNNSSNSIITGHDTTTFEKTKKYHFRCEETKKMYKPFLLISLASLPLLAQGNIQICIFLKYLSCELFDMSPLQNFDFEAETAFYSNKQYFLRWLSRQLAAVREEGTPCNFHNNSFSWRRFFLQVFCYYEGKKSPRSIDPCPCSHLLYKNVPIDADSRVRLSNQLSSDLEILRLVTYVLV